VVLNGTGAAFSAPAGLTYGGFWVTPVRGVTAAQLGANDKPVYYNTTLREFIYLTT
jgi:hypothetical protein